MAATCKSTCDRAAFFLAYDMERVLADIDADDGSPGCLRHGVLLVFGAPCQHETLAGQEHGRTIPLADLDDRAAHCLPTINLPNFRKGVSAFDC
jgi:hypothetical protein